MTSENDKEDAYFERLKVTISTLEQKRSELEKELNLPNGIETLKSEIVVLRKEKELLRKVIVELNDKKQKDAEVKLASEYGCMKKEIEKLELEEKRLREISYQIKEDSVKKKGALLKIQTAYEEESRAFRELRTARAEEVKTIEVYIKQKYEILAEREKVLEALKADIVARAENLTGRENEVLTREKEVQKKMFRLDNEINAKLKAIKDDGIKINEIRDKNVDEFSKTKDSLDSREVFIVSRETHAGNKELFLKNKEAVLDKKEATLDKDRKDFKTTRDEFLKEKQKYRWEQQKRN